MLKRQRIPIILAVSAGAALGYIAAAGNVTVIGATQPEPILPVAAPKPQEDKTASDSRGGSGTPVPQRQRLQAEDRLLAQAEKKAAEQEKKAPVSKKKPNIVFIMSDDVGCGDLGCYGGGIMRGAPTPHLDRLASEGMRFVNYYGQASCTAGRASFITGRIPIRTALSAVITPGNQAGLTAETPTIAHSLRKVGYQTVQLGKWHLGEKPENYPTSNGFDEMYHMLPWYAGVYAYPDPQLNPAWPKDDVPFQAWWKSINMGEWDGKAGQPATKTRDFTYLDLHTCDERIRDTAVKYIENHAKDQKDGKDDKPFFMFCCFMKVHQPNFPSPKWKGKSPGQYPYLDALMELDHNSGMVIDAVRKSGIAEDTIIVWTTDNGAWIDAWPDAGYTPFRGEKGSCYEGGFRVPAIVSWPGKIKAGTVATEMMCHMDWWPTFAALANTPEEDRPKHFWKDRTGKPIIFDGIDQSDYLLNPHEYSAYDQYTGFDPKHPKIEGRQGPEGAQPLKPALRQSFIYYDDNSFGGVRHKQYKFMFTTKDNWLGPSSQLLSPALFKLDWDPGEQYDILFNGAAPTVGTMKSSPGRFAGPDHGWALHYAEVVMDPHFNEMKIPEVDGYTDPYKPPPPAKGGANLFGLIPPNFAPQ